jgi:hypothetical protein
VKDINEIEKEVEKKLWKEPQFKAVPHHIKEKSNLLSTRYIGDTYINEGPMDMSKNDGEFVSGVGP